MTASETPRSWMRRIVPAGYQRATLVLTGTAPLLHNSAEYDRDSETYRAYHLLGHKRGKSLDDEQRLRELEWLLALYFDDEIGPFIPGKNVKEMLRAAATKWRKGAELVRSLVVVDYRIPLIYEGPRTPDELWEAGYRYVTMVANGGVSRGRVLRCRPMFENWSLVVELAYDPEDIDFDFLGLVVERAVKYGIGDGRTIGFGSFESALTIGELHKASTNGSALKERDRSCVAAHLALVDRVVMVA